MKKKFIVYLLSLFFIQSVLLAKEKIYLRCPSIIYKNESLGEFGKLFSEGREIMRHYIEIDILNSLEAKVSDYIASVEFYKMGAYQKASQNFKGLAQINDQNQIEFATPFTDIKESISANTIVSLSRKGSEWQATGIEIWKQKKLIDVKYFFKGDCRVLEKKEFLTLRKNSQ